MRWTVPVGDAEVPVLADDETQSTVVILAPGAGSHMEHKTISWLADLVRKPDVSMVRFNFLYKALGKSIPDRMPLLMKTYRAVIESVVDDLSPERVIIGGHSMGGRVASMIEAEGRSADGLLLFGYPLHPPEKPESLRDAHLGQISTPTLQINGTEDPLCTKELMENVAEKLDPAMWRLTWIEGADHSYAVKKSSGRTRTDVENDILAALNLWL